jgi:protein-S-isoprenylcysteine O-methyltransferase Ste14
MPRQTADTVALILAVVVAIVVLATAFALLYLELTGNGGGNLRASEAIGRIISVLIAALVGYMAGRRINGNGH